MAVVLITGCSSGIGLATALRFARRGDQVWAAARAPQAATALLAARETGLPITPLTMDVCNDASVAAALGELAATSPHVDVLVNNAGISAVGALEEAPLADARAIMETNYFGPVRLMRALLPGMRARGRGAIVNISSQAGRRPFALLAHYCASKHALGVATEVLAHEVAGHGIRVALVEPGVVRTAIFDKAPAPVAEGPYARLAGELETMVSEGLAEGSTPDDVAATVEHAVTTDAPRLHYPVGAGAADNITRYATLGPDGFVASGKPSAD